MGFRPAEAQAMSDALGMQQAPVPQQQQPQYGGPPAMGAQPFQYGAFPPVRTQLLSVLERVN